MKLMPADWPGFLDRLELWGELSIAARRAFLDGARPGLTFQPSRQDPAIDELLVAGFLEDAQGAGRLSVSQEAVGYHHVLKALERHPIFESPGLAELCAYLGDHYTPQERSPLHESLALLPGDLTRMAGLVSSTEWLQGALSRPVRPNEERAREAALILLEFLTEQRERVAIRDLPEYLPQCPRDVLPAALRHGVQRAVFFLGLRKSDQEPLVGVWAPAVRRLRRRAVILAPGPVAAQDSFGHPFLVEDMTALLFVASIHPIPLRRGDDRPYARFVEETGEMLLSLPAWLEEFTGLSLETRIGLALQALGLCGLLTEGAAIRERTRERHGARERRAGSATALCVTAEGKAWRRRSLDARRDQVVRGLAAKAPLRLFDLLEEEWTSSDEARDQIAPMLAQAFSSVPLATFVRFSDFAEYQAAIGAPTAMESDGGAGPAGPAGRGSGRRRAVATEPGRWDAAEPPSGAGGETSTGLGSGPANEEAVEELWKSFLGVFLGHCLLALGGCVAGLDEEGKSCFRMTEVGRILLGLPHAGLDGGIPLPRGPAAQDEIESYGPRPLVVQPNFEVVFLSPSPADEARLGLFSQRIGRGIGVLFRLSRESISRAARAGMTADEVDFALSRGSRSPLPSNVEHEIQDWMRITREEAP